MKIINIIMDDKKDTPENRTTDVSIHNNFIILKRSDGELIITHINNFSVWKSRNCEIYYYDCFPLTQTQVDYIISYNRN